MCTLVKDSWTPKGRLLGPAAVKMADIEEPEHTPIYPIKKRLSGQYEGLVDSISYVGATKLIVCSLVE